ncbi:MAG: amidase domain-containing protein [Oscillospiraceae bacterium]
MTITAYDRGKAVAYAHKWAFGRNPAYYNFDKIGGDCTNFTSQCLRSGGAVMNYTPVMGWYYRNAGARSPSWTGVEYLYSFLVGNKETGPFAEEVGIADMEPGDFVQLKFVGKAFEHSPFVVEVGSPATLDSILIAAHTFNSDNRPLSTYSFSDIRYIHILGVRR